MSGAWRLRTRDVNLDRTLVMGIVNVTPDSFSDGGAFYPEGSSEPDSEAAVAHGRRLLKEGADILDVGGESTRPGSVSVPVETELERVVPVVAGLAAQGAIVSVDTSKAEVAVAALEAGAEIVNDVTALGDPEMADICAEYGSGVVLMHMRGTPRTMQEAPRYDDVVGEVVEFLLERAAVAERAGVRRDRICLDPGIGFGKTLDHNLEILRRLDRFVAAGYPVLVGTSRKRFLGELLGGVAPADRDEATGTTVALAVGRGVAVVRVHDVVTALRSARIADAIVRRPSRGEA